MTSTLQCGRISVVLVNTRNPLNIGAAARAMSNFGFSDLRLVNPYEPSFHEARSAVGAGEVLKSARVYGSVAEAVADCVFVAGTTSGARRDLRQSLELLENGAKSLRNQLRAGKVAILFGSEKRGLSNQDLSHCHVLFRIPTRAEHSSMNLGQAVAVCLYEIARAKAVGKSSQSEKIKPANAKDLQRITFVLSEILRLSGYLSSGSQATADDKIRRMLRRQQFSVGDAETWLGMLRQILWKVKQSR